MPGNVAADPAYRTALRNNDDANARVAMVDALGRVMLSLVADETQLYGQYADNSDFRTWLENAVFEATRRGRAA